MPPQKWKAPCPCVADLKNPAGKYLMAELVKIGGRLFHYMKALLDEGR